MRKSIVALLVIALLGSAGAYIYFYQPFARQPALDSMLPGDTLAMVRICRLKKQIERFKVSRMGQSLARIDIPRIMTLFQVSAKDRDAFVQLSEAFKNALNSAWFDILFGQDMVVALPGSALHFNPAKQLNWQQWLSAVVILSRPKQPARVLESLNSMFSKQLEMHREPYRQWVINRFDLENGRPVYYTLTNGMLIAGFSPEPVQHCLQQSLDAAGSLVQTAAYKANCANLYRAGETDLIAFADTHAALDMAREAVAKASGQRPDLATLKKQLTDMNGLENVNMALYDDGGPLVQTATVVGIDRQRMSPLMAKAFSSRPEANRTLK